MSSPRRSTLSSRIMSKTCRKAGKSTFPLDLLVCVFVFCCFAPSLPLLFLTRVVAYFSFCQLTSPWPTRIPHHPPANNRAGGYIKYWFTAFLTEPSDSCSTDHVSIYSGSVVNSLSTPVRFIFFLSFFFAFVRLQCSAWPSERRLFVPISSVDISSHFCLCTAVSILRRCHQCGNGRLGIP